MTNISSILLPTYIGQAIFGDPASFVSTRLAGPFGSTALYDSLMPAKLDLFLGFPAGTTQYGPMNGGTVFACSGTFFDLSSEGITEQQQFMMSFADLTGLFLRPTGLRWPDNAEFWKNAIFRAAETVFSPITTYPGNQYTCTYKTVIRTLSNNC